MSKNDYLIRLLIDFHLLTFFFLKKQQKQKGDLLDLNFP